MSTDSLKLENNTSSVESFIDATDDATLKEAPLATPNNSLVAEETAQNKEKGKQIVTIFEVATELEQMLSDIVSEIVT